MKKVSLNVEQRKDSGKNVNRRLRTTGMIPAILYGGKENIMVSVNSREFGKAFKQISENVLIDMDIKGIDKKEVLIKDYQKDVVTGNVIHLDFFEILRGKKLHARIPIRLEGIPLGVRLEGGLLEQMGYDTQVECLPKDMPEEILISVEHMNVGETLHLSDCTFPEGVVALESGESVIATVAGKQEEIIEEAAIDEVAEDAEAAEDVAEDTEEKK